MHMADALISPIVGGTMWLATTGMGTYSANKIKVAMDEKKIPLMGVMGAFIFAAQMINFAIPGTGSSGHIGGGLLLAILLGPYAGFLTMASILSIQALFFADGGILALGCNIFNLGFYTCFIVYPLIYKRIISRGYSTKRIFFASMVTSILGLQLGALSVVVETYLSGKTELHFVPFVLMMLPIHLVVGIVEGLVVTTVVSYVWKTRPEMIENITLGRPIGKVSIKKVLWVLGLSALVIGGAFSWFASSDPDGLEWSLLKAAGQEEQQTSTPIDQTLEQFQEKTALLPDYTIKGATNDPNKGSWTSVKAGTSFAGIIGVGITLFLVMVIGFILNFIKKKNKVDTV